MAHRFSQLTFTPAVVQMQKRFGTAEKANEVSLRMPDFNRFGPREIEFIEARDSFYMATVNEEGWPYIQHKGGKLGFIKVMDSTSLAFVNYAGNGQYQNLGNLYANDRIALFLMSYSQRRRLKILGRAELWSLNDLPESLSNFSLECTSSRKVESIIQIQLEGFDWNCSQHITPRYNEAELAKLRGEP